MCLLKGIKIDCKDFKFSVDYEDGSLYSKCSSKFGDDLLCTNHRELYKLWCEAGGYFKVDIINSSEEDRINHFKEELENMSIDFNQFDLSKSIQRDEIHQYLQSL